MPELIPAEPGTPEWLAARRAGVTATDIVTILGLSSRDSAYSLYWRKLGQVPDEPDNDRFRLGRELEPYVLDRYQEATGGLPFKFARNSLHRSSARPWQMATVDALTATFEPVEAKTWTDADRPSWADGAPAAVRAQVLWQMDVMDVGTGHVGVVFLPSGEFRSYVIEHDPPNHPDPDRLDCAACQDLFIMRMHGLEFMGRLRLELPPPDPDSSAATLAAVRARFARQPAKQADIDPGLWERFEASCLMVDAHKLLKREAEIQLREQAGEAAELCVGGQLVARRIISDAGDRIERVEAGHV